MGEASLYALGKLIQYCGIVGNVHCHPDFGIKPVNDYEEDIENIKTEIGISIVHYLSSYMGKCNIKTEDIYSIDKTIYMMIADKVLKNLVNMGIIEMGKYHIAITEGPTFIALVFRLQYGAPSKYVYEIIKGELL
jgi:hypothetical protein